MVNRHRELSRHQETPGKEFAAFVFARLQRGDVEIPGPPKTYEELVHTPEFRLAATRVLKDFAISGVYDREKHVVRQRTDLDGKTCLALLELAGFDVSKTKYVKPGEAELGFFNLDTGGVNGVFTEGDILNEDRLKEVTAWCDNHGAESKVGESSAHFMYQALTELGFLIKHEALDKLVELVNRVESGNFDWKTEFWRGDKTIIGLERFMSIKMLLHHFLAGRSMTDEIPPEVIEEWSSSDIFVSPEILTQRKKFMSSDSYLKIGTPGEFRADDPRERTSTPEERRIEMLKIAGLATMKERQIEQRKIIKVSRAQLENLEAGGLIVDTDVGKVAVVNRDNALTGYQAAYAWGANGYLVWNPGGGSFVFSVQHGKIPFELPQGVNVRDQIWIRPQYEPGRITVSLREILLALGVKGKPSAEMRAMLTADVRAARGSFTVRPVRSPQGAYTAFTNGVFSVFPRDWQPPRGAQVINVRVAAIKKDARGKDFYILQPE